MIYEKSAGAKCSHQSFSPRCVPLLSLVQALGYFCYIYETVNCEYFRPSPPRTSGWGPSILGWCWSTPPLKTWPAWLLCGTIWRRLWSFTWRYNKHVFWFKYNLLRVWSNKAPLSLRWIPVSLAVTALFQAVMLDSTDVNMWYKIGQVAVQLVRIPLARHAFEEGLHCNPDHWPCLDNLITMLYTLSDYTCESGWTHAFFKEKCLKRNSRRRCGSDLSPFWYQN